MASTNFGCADQEVAENNPDFASTSAHSIGQPNEHSELRRTTSHLSNHLSATSPSLTHSSADRSNPTKAFSPLASENEDEDVDKDFDVHGFDHPSTYREQPWIWVPRDIFGISSTVVRELRENGIEASDEGSTMDRDGTVEVTRGPPNEEWSGGFDA